ncbi:MAG: hypothetical protein ACYDCQ_00910 [Dehalococcoidia bacterium]
MPSAHRRLRLAALFVLALTALLYGRARAQTGATFAYQPTQAGWNLISFLPPSGVDLSGPIYTWRPGAHNYDTPTTQTVGAGYWAFYHGSGELYRLDIGDTSSVDVTIPGGQCAMVGNPSRKASARVIGSSRTYVFSTVLNTYIEENLIGIGRGAWACNDQSSPATVSIVDQGDVVTPTWPDCCDPKPMNNGGLARVTVENDSPYPLIASARQLDAAGGASALTSAENNLFSGTNLACGACPEYPNGAHGDCSPSATTQVYNVAPGVYTLHLQSEGPSVPDLQEPLILLDANTSYTACWFIEADRPQKNY